MRGLLAAAALVVLLALACGGDSDEGGIPNEDLQNAVITLERTPCLGSCPAYRLTIHGDGSVVYTGLDFVAVEGVQLSRISADAVRQIVERFYEIEYFSLEDEYQCTITDLPSAITSIAIGDRTKEVTDHGGGFDIEGLDCAAPESLHGLERLIDDTTNVRQWVEEAAP